MRYNVWRVNQNKYKLKGVWWSQSINYVWNLSYPSIYAYFAVFRQGAIYASTFRNHDYNIEHNN